MDVGSQNEIIAARLIDQLIAQGVDRFCLSPGSRSTSLALAIAQNAKARSIVHFDERGIGFYALGLAKALRKPVAIVTTSGTAVGNLVPSVMESSNDHVPLIVLTADRPHELRACSSNQTIDQVKIFDNFARFQIDLPLSDKDFSKSYFDTIIAQAVYLAQFPTPGPVHLNCLFREPLVASTPIEKQKITLRVCDMPEWTPSSSSIDHWSQALSKINKGLIIVGALPHDVDVQPIFDLAEKLGFPIYADILSQLRSHRHSHLISYFDPMIQAEHHQPLEAVIHLGGRTLSKHVALWLKTQELQFYLHVSDTATLMDPYQLTTHRLACSPILFAQRLNPNRSDTTWLEFWKNADDAVHAKLSEIFNEAQLCEPSILRAVGNCLSSEIGLFLSNSMPIRDADKFLSCAGSGVPMFGNRGVSGIDGNIATAVGIAQGLKKPLIAVLGDLAFMHDMNSLALLAEAEYPVCLLVINNGGGAIFSFLPVAKKKKEIFEKFWAAAHTYSFEAIAKQFDIPYVCPDDLSALSLFAKEKKSMIIEVCTDRMENHQRHEQIAQEIKEVLQGIACH